MSGPGPVIRSLSFLLPGNFPDDDPHAGLEQIVEHLRADAAVQQISELRLEFPYEFDRDDYEQILHDVAHAVAPELGWQPSQTTGAQPARNPSQVV